MRLDRRSSISRIDLCNLGISSSSSWAFSIVISPMLALMLDNSPLSFYTVFSVRTASSTISSIVYRFLSSASCLTSTNPSCSSTRSLIYASNCFNSLWIWMDHLLLLRSCTNSSSISLYWDLSVVFSVWYCFIQYLRSQSWQMQPYYGSTFSKNCYLGKVLFFKIQSTHVFCPQNWQLIILFNYLPSFSV